MVSGVQRSTHRGEHGSMGLPPLWMPLLLRGIITRQRLNYLALIPVEWRLSFMIEHEFCMAADISKILAMGELSSWAEQTPQTDPLFHVSAAGLRLTRRAFKRVAPTAISLFIKTECFTSLWSLELLFCCSWSGDHGIPPWKGDKFITSTRHKDTLSGSTRGLILGSPTAWSHACNQLALRVFVDESQRCLFTCWTNKSVYMDVKTVHSVFLHKCHWQPMKIDTNTLMKILILKALKCWISLMVSFLSQMFFKCFQQ